MLLPAERCDHCGDPFEEGENIFAIPCIGIPGRDFRFFHHECQLRLIIGSVGHLLKRCSCYGGNEDDPPGLTRHEAAKLAVLTHMRLQQGDAEETLH